VGKYFQRICFEVEREAGVHERNHMGACGDAAGLTGGFRGKHKNGACPPPRTEARATVQCTEAAGAVLIIAYPIEIVSPHRKCTRPLTTRRADTPPRNNSPGPRQRPPHPDDAHARDHPHEQRPGTRHSGPASLTGPGRRFGSPSACGAGVRALRASF
jgi:hypothetical protein